MKAEPNWRVVQRSLDSISSHDNEQGYGGLVKREAGISCCQHVQRYLALFGRLWLQD